MAFLIKYIPSPGATVQDHAVDDGCELGEFLDDTLGSTANVDVAINGSPTTDMHRELAGGDIVSCTPRKLASAGWTATFRISIAGALG